MEDAQTAQSRMFLAWSVVWTQARAVSMFPDGGEFPVMQAWAGLPALSLIVHCHADQTELTTRFATIDEYGWWKV